MSLPLTLASLERVLLEDYEPALLAQLSGVHPWMRGASGPVRHPRYHALPPLHLVTRVRRLWRRLGAG